MDFELTIFLIIYAIGGLNAYLSGRDEVLELQMEAHTGSNMRTPEMVLRKRVADALYSSQGRLALVVVAWPLLIFVGLLRLALIVRQYKHD